MLQNGDSLSFSLLWFINYFYKVDKFTSTTIFQVSKADTLQNVIKYIFSIFPIFVMEHIVYFLFNKINWTYMYVPSFIVELILSFLNTKEFAVVSW